MQFDPQANRTAMPCHTTPCHAMRYHTILYHDQDTNKADMNGLSECAMVLSPDTVKTLRGSSPDAPLCDWANGYTLVAYLTMFTGVVQI